MVSHVNKYQRHEDKLANSFAYCQEIIKKNSNFYFAILLTPSHKRQAIFAIYAWLRAVDDITDRNESKKERLKKLEEFYQKTCVILASKTDDICEQYRERYWLAFRYSCHTFQISPTYLDAMIKGQKQDLVKTDYQTFTELYEYCYYVASSVGLICISVWGVSGFTNQQHMAEECGIALQLTNILRDMREDVSLHRVYLPAEFLDIPIKRLTADNFFDIPEQYLLTGIAKLIIKAHGYYENSRKLYRYLHQDSRLGFLLLYEAYYCIFNKIRKNPRFVLQNKKVTLTKFDKFKILIKVLWKRYLF